MEVKLITYQNLETKLLFCGRLQINLYIIKIGGRIILKTKAMQEKEFVEQVLSAGGVKGSGCMAEGRDDYWYFDLENGTRRYWKNLSIENQKILGVI